MTHAAETPTSATPQERMAAARAEAAQALAQLATAKTEYCVAFKEESLAAYREGGTCRQFDVTTRCGPERFAKSIVRQMRKLGLGLVLDHARAR